MKKVILIALISLLMTACTQTKIGYINVEELMKDYQATIDLETRLKTKQGNLAKQLDSLGKAFDAKLNAYKKIAPKMSTRNRNVKEQELLQEQQMLQQKQQDATQELQKDSQESSTKLTKDIEGFVADYAKTNGYNIMLGTSGAGTVMYGDTNLNLTTDVTQKLNKSYNSKKDK